MTQIVVLPHSEYCPDGAVIEADQALAFARPCSLMILRLSMPAIWCVPAQPVM